MALNLIIVAVIAPTLKRHISRPNALFVWASTDEYIEERKGITSTTKLKDNGQDQTQDKSQQIQNGTNNRPTDDSKTRITVVLVVNKI